MISRINKISGEEGYSESRLPVFSEEEVAFIKGSFDFLGLNHYTSQLVSDAEYSITNPTSYEKDIGVFLENDPTWGNSSVNWLKVNPKGLRNVLNWIKNTYNNPYVIITENGFSDVGETNDTGRIDYFRVCLL